MRIARGIAALSVASLAFGLAACSEDVQDTSDEVRPSTEAGQPDVSEDSTEDPATEDSSSEDAASGSGDLTTENFAERLTAATVEAGSYSIDMTTEAAGASGTISADVELTDSTTNMAMTMDQQGMQMEIRVVDAIFYLNLGEVSNNMFVMVDPADESNPLAAQFSGIEEQLDPTASLEGFEGAFSSVEKVGEPVDVDGVQAQQYTVVVDTTKVTGQLQEQAEAAGAALPPELTYEYWVDDQDRMVRTTSEVAGATVDMTFSGWGEDFGITAPAEDEISTEPLF
jgi:lipoprotein LprG